MSNTTCFVMLSALFFGAYMLIIAVTSCLCSCHQPIVTFFASFLSVSLWSPICLYRIAFGIYLLSFCCIEYCFLFFDFFCLIQYSWIKWFSCMQYILVSFFDLFFWSVFWLGSWNHAHWELLLIGTDIFLSFPHFVSTDFLDFPSV